MPNGLAHQRRFTGVRNIMRPSVHHRSPSLGPQSERSPRLNPIWWFHVYLHSKSFPVRLSSWSRERRRPFPKLQTWNDHRKVFNQTVEFYSQRRLVDSCWQWRLGIKVDLSEQFMFLSDVNLWPLSHFTWTHLRELLEQKPLPLEVLPRSLSRGRRCLHVTSHPLMEEFTDLLNSNIRSDFNEVI